MNAPSQPTPEREFPELHRLLAIVDRLRAPGGCPWDREQTIETMGPHLLEEAYEAIDAIDAGDDRALAEELGDVLMNVLMIARIASEDDRFDIEDVAAAIADKLVRRHPHVFGDVEVEGAEDVLRSWEAIKQRERRTAGKVGGALAGVPAALPSLLRAFRIGEKAARVGFDWPDASGPRSKIDEELEELDTALAEGDDEAIAHELGDLLFSVVNVARHAGIEPETALRRTVERFTMRFARIEALHGPRLDEVGIEALDAAWNDAKAADAPEDGTTSGEDPRA